VVICSLCRARHGTESPHHLDMRRDAEVIYLFIYVKNRRLYFFRARLTIRSPSPTHLDMRLDAEMEKKVAFDSVAVVLPLACCNTILRPRALAA